MIIVLHCSDSAFGNAALIAKWHLAKKWSNIGYHYVILNGRLSPKCLNLNYDGHIETGRPLDDDNMLEPDEFGAHVRGKNREAIGICLVGNSGVFTHSQLVSAGQLIKQLGQQFENIEVHQHSYYDNKKAHCAGLNDEQMTIINNRND